jgi:hypothetical protein
MEGGLIQAVWVIVQQNPLALSTTQRCLQLIRRDTVGGVAMRANQMEGVHVFLPNFASLRGWSASDFKAR